MAERGGGRHPAAHGRAAVVGAATATAVVAAVLAAALAAELWRFGPTEITESFSSPPSWSHPLGTDTVGRDLLARVLRGVQNSARSALVVAVVSTAIGVTVGTVAGYTGGVVDTALVRLTDAVLMVPGIAVLAVLASSRRGAAGDPLGGSWLFIALVLSGFLWTHKARLVRGQVLVLRESGYVEAARAAGAGHGRILTRHVLPHIGGLAVVAGTVTVAGAILAEAALSYLGLGIRPPDTSLGTLVAEGQAAASTRPWLFFAPGATLVTMVLAVAAVGEVLRRALGAGLPGAREVTVSP